MTILDLTSEVLDKDYHGCGKVWAAVRDGKVVALRYMEDHPGDYRAKLPEWVKAVEKAANGCDNHMLPTSHGSKNLAAIAAAAQACEDCPKPPKKERYRPTELLAMARACLIAFDGDSFINYRAKCREELSKLGDVVSGMCSCTQFYPKN